MKLWTLLAGYVIAYWNQTLAALHQYLQSVGSTGSLGGGGLPAGGGGAAPRRQRSTTFGGERADQALQALLHTVGLENT